jgi:hypothetical protein
MHEFKAFIFICVYRWAVRGQQTAGEEGCYGDVACFLKLFSERIKFSG